MLFLLALLALVGNASAMYSGAFDSQYWVQDTNREVDPNANVRFVVAMKLRNAESMHDHFMAVSMPKSPSYGQYLSLQEIRSTYGPHQEDRHSVIAFFSTIPGAVVKDTISGDLFEVSAPVHAIESRLKTKLSWRTDSRQITEKKSLRADLPLTLPAEIEHLLSFISLNTPVNHVAPRGAKSLSQRKKLQSQSAAAASAATLSVSTGNEEAQISFQPYCADGAISTTNPPCVDQVPANPPVFLATVTEHANSISDPYQLETDPRTFTFTAANTFCYDSNTKAACPSTAGVAGVNCVCVAKLSPLPKYVQLQANLTSTFAAGPTITPLGVSSLFALTDVATGPFLSNLYSIPKGLSVQHGSNQSVAEFYGEFYSNSDLAAFMSLSGLPNATIPVANNYGDLANDQSVPGGEAQLDVEYIMALAPGADTFFYSFSDLNPYNEINEGFLTYLLTVSDQEYPPLVHSLSYGDVEANVFNASNNGSIEYGQACDQQFMLMGLRGLSVIFSSGDDGIGNNIVRDDPTTACSQAWPAWPASSPYVTAVGATQLTDKYLPACGKPYSTSITGLPESAQLLFECTGTGETVCSSTFGGVVTSGGGFSDVYDRATYAPWQETAVNNYLIGANSAAYPPTTYFNPAGRAYPDVSTYGSNYFVYLGGQIVRESGTSASAPVFAAMVTLWNDIRLAYSQPPMGFIAPFLYEIYATHPDAFQDVVTGNNACGAGHSIDTVNCCEYSYEATPGWDASTGLGSPNFEIISNLVINNATYFPNVGSYPDGKATPQSITYASNDDDDVSNEADIAFYIAIAALVAAVISWVVIIYIVACKSSGSDGNGNQIKSPLFN